MIWNKIGRSRGTTFEIFLPLARKSASMEHALKIDKTYAGALNNVGTVYYAQKKYRSAVSRYGAVFPLAPDKPAI